LSALIFPSNDVGGTNHQSVNCPLFESSRFEKPYEWLTSNDAAEWKEISDCFTCTDANSFKTQNQPDLAWFVDNPDSGHHDASIKKPQSQLDLVWLAEVFQSEDIGSKSKVNSFQDEKNCLELQLMDIKSCLNQEPTSIAQEFTWIAGTFELDQASSPEVKVEENFKDKQPDATQSHPMPSEADVTRMSSYSFSVSVPVIQNILIEDVCFQNTKTHLPVCDDIKLKSDAKILNERSSEFQKCSTCIADESRLCPSCEELRKTIYRQESIKRWKEKRKSGYRFQRVGNEKRSKIAQSRPRIGGRFIKLPKPFT
jgi:hypothetical protein